MDTDPNFTSLQCADLLDYAEAKHAYENTKDEKVMDRLRKSDVIQLVEKNWFDLRREARGNDS